MTYSRFLVNVCFVIGSLSRRFVMMCWSAASLQLCLFSVSHWVYNLMQTHATPYAVVGFVHAFQVRICTCISRSREHKYPNYVLLGRKINCPYSCTNEDIREFKSNNSLQCCHEVRIGKQNVHAYKIYSGKKKKNVHQSLQIVLPTSQRTPFSKFAICFMNSKLRHWSHKYNVITFFQNLLYLRVWANDIWRGIGQCTHCFTSCYLMPIDHQNNGLQPVLLDSSLANKKTLIDITEPAILHEYGSGNFFVQQLSL